MHQAPLSHLCFSAAQGRGRRYPEPPHPYRNDFQRDRDRIVHSRAFRRLEDKTQVFPPGISDHFRTRLTHTFEVSQLSRTVANALGLEESLTEALALVHDIGHPPFGHAGEDELNRCMSRYSARFDHNLHALRIVEQFEERYARFSGLNLTFEVREGIVKHSRELAPGESVELDEYLPGLRPPLEAQLIDLADEIAYNTADIDDAFSAGMFHLDALAEAVPRYAQIREEIEMQFPGAEESVQFNESLRRVIDWLVSGLIEGTVRAAEEARAKSAEDVRASQERLAAFTPEAAAANRALKTFLHERVYNSPELVRERSLSVSAIQRLFDHYIKQPDDLPRRHRDRGEPLHRIICDYIAGMTEGYFYDTYTRLVR